MSSFLEMLRTARKTCMVQDGRKKVHFTFPDETELVEEYDSRTGVLIVRKWRRKTTLGGAASWDFEVGEDVLPAAVKPDEMRESSQNPIFVRQDGSTAFQWRIRNLPYSLDVYSISVSEGNLVLRTSNKKYFKRFAIPDLQRLSLDPDPARISLAHANNTLLITYAKPPEVLRHEQEVKRMLSELQVSKDGDVNCNPS